MSTFALVKRLSFWIEGIILSVYTLSNELVPYQANASQRYLCSLGAEYDGLSGAMILKLPHLICWDILEWLSGSSSKNPIQSKFGILVLHCELAQRI